MSCPGPRTRTALLTVLRGHRLPYNMDTVKLCCYFNSLYTTYEEKINTVDGITTEWFITEEIIPFRSLIASGVICNNQKKKKKTQNRIESSSKFKQMVSVEK